MTGTWTDGSRPTGETAPTRCRAGQTKEHYYKVHTGLNPSKIVPAGPDLSGWLTRHRREELGGRPFGDGTPPGPPPLEESVTAQGRA